MEDNIDYDESMLDYMNSVDIANAVPTKQPSSADLYIMSMQDEPIMEIPRTQYIDDIASKFNLAGTQYHYANSDNETSDEEPQTLGLQNTIVEMKTEIDEVSLTVAEVHNQSDVIIDLVLKLSAQVRELSAQVRELSAQVRELSAQVRDQKTATM
jgi:methyl-accepting chemotaxis protein